MQSGSITLITTGGTIAGYSADACDTAHYTAGTLPASELLAALGRPEGLPPIHTEALLCLDSKDMTPGHWRTMAQAVEAARSHEACDGVVLTHGTDTLEETAWFLHLVCPPGKPIVLTAAMRPATALSADGPMNLYQALRVAALPQSHRKGVLVVMNDQIFSATDVAKTHTRATEAIGAPNFGPVGDAIELVFHRAVSSDSAGLVPLERIARRAPLPVVEILYVGAGSNPAALADAMKRQCAGVVLALPGNGSLPDSWRDTALEAVAAGVRIVRASRTGRGAVSSHATSVLPGSGVLNPLQARIALLLDIASEIEGLFGRLAAHRV